MSITIVDGNFQGLQLQHEDGKLQTLLHMVAGADIILGQETHHREAFHLEGYSTLCSTPTPNGRKGVIVAVSAARTQGDGARRFELVREHTSSHYQYLAARWGTWLLVSVYFYCEANPHLYNNLAAELAALRSPDLTGPMVVGGDFNHPESLALLRSTMASSLGLRPSLVPGQHITRPGRQSTPGGGVESQASESGEEAETNGMGEEGPMTQTGSLIDDVYLSPHLRLVQADTCTGFPSDHLLVRVVVEAGRPTDDPPPTPSEPRIRWRHLKDKTTVQAFLQRFRELVQLHAEPDIAIIQAAIQIAGRDVLGTYRMRYGARKPWFNLECQQALRECHRAGTRRRRRIAHREFTRCCRRAKAAAHEDLMYKVAAGEICVWVAVSSRRKGHSGASTHPHLKEAAVGDYFRQLYTPQPGSISADDIPPYVQQVQVTISDELVEAVAAAWRPTAPGPDGVPVEAVKLVVAAWPLLFAAAFTACLGGHFPPALRCGRTVLVAKKKKLSADPADYRPLLLFVVMFRLYLACVNREFCAMLFRNPPMPGHFPAGHPVQPVSLSRAQAGFVPGRHGLNQAALLHQLTAVLHKSLPSKKGPRIVMALLLDIKKAFDTLDHPSILDNAEHTLGLEPQWLEILRDVLSHNTTRVMGTTVELRRGDPQGGAIYPSVLLTAMDELPKRLLADAEFMALLRASLREHKDAFPERLVDQLLVLLVLLLFADDINLVTSSMALTERFLEVAGKWAEDRRIEFSEKSRVVVVGGVGDEGCGVPRVPLALQHIQVAWHGTQPEDKPLARYLGVPVRPWRKYQHRDAAFPVDTEWLAKQLLGVGLLFQPEGGGAISLVIPALRQILMGETLTKCLYPSAVVELEYTIIDTHIQGFLRRVLQVPPATPSALLWRELRMAPSEFQAHRLALLQVERVVRSEWWWREIVLELLKSPALSATRKLWLGNGPLKRWGDLIYRYRTHLFAGELHAAAIEADRDRVWYCVRDFLQKHPPGRWRERVNKAIAEAITEAWEQKVKSYPAYLQQHVRMVVQEVDKRGRPLPHPPLYGSGRRRLPYYIKHGYLLAAVGLRWKLPGMRILSRSLPEGRPACVLCGALAGECPRHLLSCTALHEAAPDLRDRVDSLLQHIIEQTQHHSAQPREAAKDRFMALQWAGQEPFFTRVALRLAMDLLNKYRDLCVARDPQLASVLWKVRCVLQYV